MAEKIMIPLVFRHVYSSAPWGGGWLRSLFARTDAPEICSESWEISGHPYGMSVVDGGIYDGRTLDSLVREFGVKLIGTKAPDKNRFPLLIKLLDARRSLSIQVHPNDRNAEKTGGEPKTEAWVVLEAAPGAALYAGVAPKTNESEFRTAVDHGEALVGMLSRHRVNSGDVIYIPGGVVHAIGAGCLVFEVQQSSDTTYRLYDWDRIDSNGRARPLHIPQAMQSIDFNFPPVRPHRRRSLLVHSRYFTVRQIALRTLRKIRLNGSTFLAIFVLDGGVKITSGGASVEVMRGSSALVPADAKICEIDPRTTTTKIILTTL